MARNKNTKMKFVDTKHLCEDFIKRERDFSEQILKWVSCQNGYRLRSFYMCKLVDLYCPYHWKPEAVNRQNRGWHTLSGYG